MIAAGIKDDGMSKKIPGGLLETGGIIADKFYGNKNDEFRELGSLGDIAINAFAIKGPATLIEKVALGVQVMTTVIDLIDENSNTKESGDSKKIDIDKRSAQEQKMDNTRIIIPVHPPVLDLTISREEFY